MIVFLDTAPYRGVLSLNLGTGGGGGGGGYKTGGGESEVLLLRKWGGGEFKPY